MCRKNAKERLVGRRAVVKTCTPALDVLQSHLHLEAAKLIAQWAACQGGLVVENCYQGSNFCSSLELLETFYGGQERRVSSRTIHDSPQRAEWTEDDDYFLREKDCKSARIKYVNYGLPPLRSQHAAKVSSRGSVSSIGRDNKRPKQDLINQLPDELLLQIFSFLPRARDRAICASVSMRWLMLQSHMQRDEFKVFEEQPGKGDDSVLVSTKEKAVCKGGHEDMEVEHEALIPAAKACNGDQRVERQPQWANGDLSRCLEGKKATDVRLAAIAVGTGARGGLGKLTIRGGGSSEKGVTDAGLSAIGYCCLALKDLFLWNCFNIRDESLSIIGRGCRLLQKLDLVKCPALGDLGLQSVGRNCKMLSYVSLDDCPRVGDRGLTAIGEGCPELETLTIRNCSRVGDAGLESVFTHCKKLKKVTLEGLRVGDRTLLSIGLHCRALLSLSLHNLESVTDKGFVLFSKAPGLPALKRVSISCCKKFSDEALATFGSNLTGVKHMILAKCEKVSDVGLSLFVHRAPSLEVLHVERCNLISEKGFIAVLASTANKLREVKFKKCDGIEDGKVGLFFPPCIARNSTMKCVSLANCAGVGNRCIALLGLLCPQVISLDLSGLTNLSDEGLWAFLCSGTSKLSSVNLSGCVKLTDRAVCAVAQQCGESLKDLVLDGCKLVTDKGIMAIAKHCNVVEDLDVSQCTITDDGVMVLAYGVGDSLSSLNLSGCSQITDKALGFIEQRCEDLMGLNLKHCKSLTPKVVDNFMSQMWRCDVLRSQV